jgi:tetratricopeptide (TPR) repeat protein
MPKALAIMQLAYDAGLIVDGSEITRLADLLLFNNIPYRCATLMDEAFAKKQLKPDAKLYQKQSQCWIAAREYKKSLTPLGRAADMSNSGDLYVRMGEVQVQLNEWGQAAESLSRGISKGGLQDASYAQLMLGIAYYNDKKLTQAENSFKKARSSNKHRRTADGYLQLIRAQAS